MNDIDELAINEREVMDVFQKEEEIDSMDADERVKILTEEIFQLMKSQKIHEDIAEEEKGKRTMKEESLYKLLENMGVKSIRTKFGTFGRGKTFRAYYHEEDREKVSSWLKEIGAEGLVKPTVNANTFTAFIKEKMVANELAGMPKDDGIPEFVLSFTKDKITYRKK